jgi:hypothetical protein
MRRLKARRRFNSLTILAIESQHVIGLRMMKLMLGGKGAQREAELMISEKIQAAVEAGTRLMSGASGDEIVRRYRRRVASNAKRLTKSNLGPAKRTRRRK